MTSDLYDGHPPVEECAEVPDGILLRILTEFAGYKEKNAPRNGPRPLSATQLKNRRPRWLDEDEEIPANLTAEGLVLSGLDRSLHFENELTNVWYKSLELQDGSDTSQSGWDLQLACVLLRWGFPDRFIGDLLHEYRTDHSADTQHPEKALRPDYVARTIEAAERLLPDRVSRARLQTETSALEAHPKSGKPKKRSKDGPPSERLAAKPPRLGSEKSPDDREVVRIFPSNLPSTNDAAQEALLKREAALGAMRTVYSQGGALVHLVGPKDGPAKAAPITIGSIREHMGRAVFFLRVSDDPEEDPVPVDYPKDYASSYLARGAWPFPVLRGISRVPLLLPTGDLVEVRGFNSDSGVFVDIDESDWNGKLEADPTEDSARCSLQLLHEALREFPFSLDADRSAGLAALLTGVARHLFDFAPLFVVSAPSRGAGKSELVELVAMVSTGRRARGYQFTKDTAEMDKLFHSIFMESSSVVHLENVEVDLRGAPLCTALTQEKYARRILGVSATSAPVTTGTTWLASGVNLGVASDVVRRVLRCDLDPQMERPEERKFDRNLSAWAKDNRRQLVAACLTILAAYLRAGRPEQEMSSWAGFEGWNGTVRAALLWLGQSDPCSDRRRLDEEDPERENFALVLGTLAEAFGGEKFTCQEAVARAAVADPAGNALAAACCDVLQKPTARCLGNYLKARKGRIVNGFRCVRAGTRSNRTLWRVERAEGSG